MLSDLRFRLRSLFHRNEMEGEMNDEIRFHREHHVEKYVQAGFPREEAERRATLEFGGEDKIKEECRDSRGVGFVEILLHDLRFGARTLRKDLGFTIVTVVTLALGMGATTTIFSVVDGLLLRPLPYGDPGSLVGVWEYNTKTGNRHNTAAPPDFLDWQSQNTVFTQMAAMADTKANLTGNGDPEQVVVGNVSANFFSLLGVNPIVGSGFSSANGEPGKDDVVVLEYGFWKERFGGDPAIVGKSLELNGHAKLVAGVAPPNFNLSIKDGSLTGSKPQMWAPWVFPKTFSDRKQSGRFLTVIARMKPGVSEARAQDQMSTIAARLQQEYPDFNGHWSTTVLSLREQLSGNLRPAIMTLFCAVAFVLLIACANVSSLLLARAAKREREMAIRNAIGASRWRIARQLLTECLLLAGIGSTLGLLLALLGTNALLAVSPKDLLDLHSVQIDGRLLAFAAALAVISTFVFGFIPSYIGSHAPIAEALKEEGRGASASGRRKFWRGALVVGQMGLALVLLAGSGLTIRSFLRLMQVDPGFDTHNLLTFQVRLPGTKYQKDEAISAFFDELVSRISRLPGVKSASMENYPPLTGLGAATGVRVVGSPPMLDSDLPVSGARVVGPNYFRTMQIPLLAGRFFDETELKEERHVVVVNQAFVEKYLAGENPLGKKLIIYMRDRKVDENNPSEIIGVSGSVHQMGLGEEAKPNVYWPMPELVYSQMTLLVRSSNAFESLIPAIRQQLHEIDPQLPMAALATMDELLSDSLSRSRFTMFLLGLFAGLALLLTAVGVYGVIAYSVAQRTHEIGIRMALGAQRGNVLGLVLGQGTKLTLLGVGIGVVLALALTHFMASLLYGVASADPLTFLAVSLLLCAVAFIASYLPARNATRVSPIVALRYE
jgi:putative ABC transport system permease protein